MTTSNDSSIATGMGIRAQMEISNAIQYKPFSQKDLEDLMNQVTGMSKEWKVEQESKKHPKRKLPWQKEE